MDTTPGPVAVIVPAAPGASLDWTSDAWFEALEIATAPRIEPPSGVVPACPGEQPPGDPVDFIGNPFHVESLSPVEVQILSDADAVASWALSSGMTVTVDTYDAMVSLAGQRFVVARFDAPNGEALTPALRVSGPGVAPVLPLVLTHADASADLEVAVWTIGSDTAVLDGPQAMIDQSAISYDAADGSTNYANVRATALSNAGLGASLIETSSRTSIDGELEAAGGDHIIEGVVRSYFNRAATYEGGSFNAQTCIVQVESAIGAADRVAMSCPRADLGVVEGTPSCTEVVQSSEVDPALLRCGNEADDIAVAFSELIASDGWLTRHAMSIPSGNTGALHNVTIQPGPTRNPIVIADNLDLSNCDTTTTTGPGAGGMGGTGGSGTGGAPTTSAGGAAGSVNYVSVPVYEVDTGCGAETVGAVLFYIDVSINEEPPDAYYQEEEDCGGDTSDSYSPVYEDDSEDNGIEDDIVEDADSGGCSGDSSDSSDTSSGDDCGGDTSESYESSETGSSSESSDSGGDCGGDTSESSDDGGGCGGDTSDSYSDDSSSDDSSSDDSSSDSSDDSSSDDSGCGGDTSESYDDSSSDDSSSDSSSDDSADGSTDCGGDTSDYESDSSDSWDDSSDSWDDSDDSSDSGSDSETSGDTECTIKPRAKRKAKRRRTPRLSVLIMGLLAIVVPLRRFTRRSRHHKASAHLRRIKRRLRRPARKLRRAARRLARTARRLIRGAR